MNTYNGWNTWIYCPNCGDEDARQKTEDAAYNGDSIECRSCHASFYTMMRIDAFGDNEYKPVPHTIVKTLK